MKKNLFKSSTLGGISSNIQVEGHTLLIELAIADQGDYFSFYEYFAYSSEDNDKNSADFLDDLETIQEHVGRLISGLKNWREERGML